MIEAYDTYELSWEDLCLKVSELCQIGEAELAKKGGMERILKLMVRFPELSVESLILLSIQRPNAMQLGTEEDFLEISNPIRTNATPIYLYEGDEIRKWYEVSDTCDAPSEQTRKEKDFCRGILPMNPMRSKSVFYRFMCSSLYKRLCRESEPNGEAMKELATRLVFGAPFAIEARDARRWAYFCEVHSSFFWNEQKKSLFVKRGVTGADFAMELIRTRAYLIAKEQKSVNPWEMCEYVRYTFAELLQLGRVSFEKGKGKADQREKVEETRQIVMQLMEVLG